MKEYKRSIGWSLLSSFMSLIMVGVMLGVFMYFFPGSEIKMMLGIAAVVLVLLAVSLVSDLKQTVTPGESKIVFKNFKIKNVRSFAFGSLKTENTKQDLKEFDIPCAKIEKIEAGRDILFWRFNLHMVVDGIPTPIVISSAMENHKQLYSEIIDCVRKTNSTVYVDKKFSKYL